MPDSVYGGTTTRLRGLASIVFGVAALLFPGLPSINLPLLFGAYGLADGVLAFAEARAGVGGAALRWLFVGEGLVSIGAGLVTFAFYPLWSIGLPRLISAWVVGTGLLRLGEAILRRQDTRSGGPLLLAGLASLPVSYFLFVTPIQNQNALTLVRLIGVYAVGMGLILLVIAGRLYEPRRSRVP